MINPLKIDFHMHTTVSDGTDTPEMMPERIRQCGIRMFSVTDHDAVKGCKVIQSVLTENDPVFISGVEFSCRDEEGQYHILGYGYDVDSPAIHKVVETGHQYRMNKVRARLEFIRNEYGFSFAEEDIEKLLALDNPGKPHIGNLMVKYGFAETKQQAINQYINKIRFKGEYIRPEEAMDGIIRSGGIPVLAHPCFGSGDQLILGEDLNRRLQRLMDCGLQGVEGYYSGFTKKMREQVLSFAAHYGLYVTAGSDYHGANKTVVLGDTGLAPDEVRPEGLRRFIEVFTGQ